MKKGEELNTTTGVHVKTLIIPNWHGGKAKVFNFIKV
jgi:hypothetical protein